jgi:hypothetical protein
MFAVIVTLMLGGTFLVRNQFLTEQLWAGVKPYVRPETKVGCYGFGESSLVWKFRAVVTNNLTLGEEKRATDFLTNTPPYILVLPTKDLAKLGDTNGVQIPVHGFDMVKFKYWDLTAIVRQP